MSQLLRVREPGKSSVLNPETGVYEVPNPLVAYSSDHPLVKAHPWMFATDEELQSERDAASGVERATAAPGERRTIRRQGRGYSGS